MMHLIEKVGALQVCVAVGLASPQLSRIDHHVDRAPDGIVGVKFHAPFDILEVPTHPRDHHVARSEPGGGVSRDRKSTRLNSSHRCISYAVFCLKKTKPPARAPTA